MAIHHHGRYGDGAFCRSRRAIARPRALSNNGYEHSPMCLSRRRPTLSGRQCHVAQTPKRIAEPRVGVAGNCDGGVVETCDCCSSACWCSVGKVSRARVGVIIMHVSLIALTGTASRMSTVAHDHYRLTAPEQQWTCALITRHL